MKIFRASNEIKQKDSLVYQVILGGNNNEKNLKSVNTINIGRNNSIVND